MPDSCFIRAGESDKKRSIYLGIPEERTKVKNGDFEPESKSSTRLKGGFYYGKSRNGTVYIVPRPLLNHGIHRCKSLCLML